MNSKKQIFGLTDGVRGKANEYPLDVSTIVKLGQSLAEYAKKIAKPNPNRDLKVIIGKDTRRSGYMMEQALTSGFLSRGVDVITVGPIPTPGISRLVQSFALDLGIMITASHNPFYDNGFKVFDPNGLKISDEAELKIEDIFFNYPFEPIEKIGRAKRIEDVSGRYVEYVKSSISDISLNGYTIVVDSANGATYKTAPTVFQELGAKVISIGNAPNGYNINKDCGAMHPQRLQAAVIKSNANFGVAIDGDGDRAIFVDENGEVIDGDYIMALVAKYFKERDRLNHNTIVATKYSNVALEKYLKSIGIKTLHVINGDKEVSKLLEKHDLNFGGEVTGHYIFRDYSDVGDAIMAALLISKILIDENKPLSTLAKVFKKSPRILKAVEIKERKPFESIPELYNYVQEYNNNNKGIARIFLRYSGTENLLRILIEADTQAEVKAQMAKIEELVNTYLL